MRILVAVPYYSLGTTGLFLVKALGELGCSCLIWDYRISPRPPLERVDLVLAWTTEHLDFGVNQECKKVLIYPDDVSWWMSADHSRTVDAIAPDYYRVYTVNKIDGFDWLPLGCDPDLHKRVDVPLKYDVLFIGTLRDPERRKFVDEFRMRMPVDWNFKVFGNNWDLPGCSGPVYYADFVREVCSAKVVLNQHFNLGPSTKDLEIAACGGGILVSDNAPGLRDLFPTVPVYYGVFGAIEGCRIFLEDPVRRAEDVEILRKAALECSYRVQLERVLGEFVRRPWSVLTGFGLKGCWGSL